MTKATTQQSVVMDLIRADLRQKLDKKFLTWRDRCKMKALLETYVEVSPEKQKKALRRAHASPKAKKRG